MTVDNTDLKIDPSPTGYEQFRTERAPDKITHCYRYVDRVVELYYRKEDHRLDLENDELYNDPWIIEEKPVDPSWYGPDRLALFIEQAFGLHVEIESWTILNGLPQMTVDPDAGVVVRNLRGEVAEMLVPPAEGVDAAQEVS